LQAAQAGKEQLASEKKWFDFINKHKGKFKSRQSIANLTESVYSIRWFNMDYWRTRYYNYVTNELQITKPDNLWTFDIIQFPYVINNNVLKQPESDYSLRPKSVKPRVSVLFAFNAAGDYLQPFIVYPPNFDANVEEASSSSTISDVTPLAHNEYISPNGFVTCRVFEHWLFKCFLPYVNEQRQSQQARGSQQSSSRDSYLLLLFCAKLALVDKQVLSKVHDVNAKHTELKLNFFTLNTESLQPFGFLLKVI
jgi:hypothetical protein